MSSSDGGQSRKRLVVGVLSVCLLVAMVIGTVMFFVSEKAGYDSELRKRNMSKTMRSVELFCAPADYQGTCHETLETALSRTDPAKHPHAAAAAAITAVERALAEGFNRTSVLDAVRQSNDTLLVVRQPRRGQPAVVTAQARRDHQQTTGFVIHRSQIVADEQLLASSSGESGSAPVRTYLGRPWKEFARTVVMESTIDGFVHGQGYMPWEGKDSLGTAFFGEFRNAGDGANVTGRKDMQGFHVMGKDKALQFTVGHFLHGADWIPETGTPVSLGLSGEEE
ncbi:putative pectinesterase/pectinesterase inhibitor 13 [Zea mays]|uniref:Putative pectinesterase/pectinesterase inhibitor 13 n=1 Tax=Zea mays TaxID=4577 RepID=A0A1D6P828_MAIZE|nr:putative pectinesterase/pectinesterase inhibitor 13 [Zea mays]